MNQQAKHNIVNKDALSLFKVLISVVLINTAAAAQRAQPFIYDCVTPGQNMSIDAIITNADATTFYHWQYKSGTDGWTCFIEGVNHINGASFTVSGATGVGANNAPTLTIFAATTSLENVLVRVTMARGADPCGTPQPDQVYGGDDETPGDTKYLRLHVFTNSFSCPPYVYQCEGNLLISSGKYYGGFENTNFHPASETYERKNFVLDNASSDFSFGNGKKHYQDINNPYAMNASFARNIAPHTGDYQLVVEGSSVLTDRAWYKTIPVVAGRQYAFSAWVARVDNTSPLLELRANSSLLATGDLTLQQIGAWKQIQGTFTAQSTTMVDFSIRDGRPGGNNNFTLDDICLRECSGCSILELHQLYLSARLEKTDVKLKWVAENEMGTANFIIEKSMDGIAFERIGTRELTGLPNVPTLYQFTDDVQNAGIYQTLYYRIKALDTDGRYAYSNLVIVRLKKAPAIQAWPSPFTDQVNITYASGLHSQVQVSIINSLGKVLKQSLFNITRGRNQLKMQDLNALSAGIYFVRIIDVNTSEVYIQKISK